MDGIQVVMSSAILQSPIYNLPLTTKVCSRLGALIY